FLLIVCFMILSPCRLLCLEGSPTWIDVVVETNIDASDFSLTSSGDHFGGVTEMVLPLTCHKFS
ncbi:MAG: hypothetical protein ACOZBW_08780, partial [Thermodesulfobacteriota bacterium]